MSKYILEFEKPIKILEDKILKLKSTASSTGLDNSDLINHLEADLNRGKTWEEEKLALEQYVQCVDSACQSPLETLGVKCSADVAGMP